MQRQSCQPWHRAPGSDGVVTGREGGNEGCRGDVRWGLVGWGGVGC